MFHRAALVLVGASLLAAPALAAEPKIESEQDKTLYAIGLFLGRNLGTFQLTEAELEIVKAGLTIDKDLYDRLKSYTERHI